MLDTNERRFIEQIASVVAGRPVRFPLHRFLRYSWCNVTPSNTIAKRAIKLWQGLWHPRRADNPTLSQTSVRKGA